MSWLGGGKLFRKYWELVISFLPLVESRREEETFSTKSQESAPGQTDSARWAGRGTLHEYLSFQLTFITYSLLYPCVNVWYDPVIVAPGLNLGGFVVIFHSQLYPNFLHLCLRPEPTSQVFIKECVILWLHNCHAKVKRTLPHVWKATKFPENDCMIVEVSHLCSHFVKKGGFKVRSQLMCNGMSQDQPLSDPPCCLCVHVCHKHTLTHTHRGMCFHCTEPSCCFNERIICVFL